MFAATSCTHEAAGPTTPKAPTHASARAEARPPNAARSASSTTPSESDADDPIGKAGRAEPAPASSSTATVHIHGAILNESGHPLPGAKVTLMTDGLMRVTVNALTTHEDSTNDLPSSKGTQVVELVSAADGTFGSDAITPGALDLEVSLKGFTRYKKDLGQLAPGARIDDLEVVLHPTDWVAGMVQKSDGTPVANAAVHIEGPHTGPKGRPTFAQDNALSGPDGRFRYDALPPGPYTLMASLGDPLGALWRSEGVQAVSGSVSALLTLKR